MEIGKMSDVNSSGFKVGDKVFDLRYGNGVVTDITDNRYYSINVSFENIFNNYLNDGKSFEKDLLPILYHGHDLIVEVKEPEYEYQVTYKTYGKYALSGDFYKNIEDFKDERSEYIFCAKVTDIELFEPSKRLVKKV
jgi:hypothetical protein